MSTDSESKVHDSGNIQETTVPRNEQQDEVFDSTQPGFPVFHRKVGSPLPLGTFLISGILWVIGLLLLGARGTTIQNFQIVMGIPGGLTIMALGALELILGNTFGCALFTTFGSILTAASLLNVPFFGLLEAFKVTTDPNGVQNLYNALGILTFGVVVVVTIFLLASQRTTIPVALGLLLVDLYAILYGASLLLGKISLQRAAGGVLMVTCVDLWYVVLSALLLDEGSAFLLPPFALPQAAGVAA